ncbi:transcriptional regulator, partial [Candidatus Bathyarchaeota archaeon]|nr:transcriptional regulator [Candidatus Bathyarchaeota archaeon]
MKRNNLDICADILRVSRGGAKKTHLVYKANLNFNIVKKYI